MFTKDEIIKLNNSLDVEDEAVKITYGIKRNFNREWNTETSTAIVKYIKYYDDIVDHKSTSNNNNVVTNNSVSLEL